MLDGPRARGAFLLRSLLDPPWSLRIQDEAPLTVVAVVRGTAWIVPDGPLVPDHRAPDGRDAVGADRPRRDGPTALCEGDVAIVRGPDPYTVAHEPGAPPQVIIHPEQRCTTPDGVDVHEAMDLGVRTWGNSPTGSTVLLTGTYEKHGEVSGRLLSALPPLVVLSKGALDSSLVELLSEEVVKDLPGQEIVLDRLLDLLLIAAVRAWLAMAADGAPAWLRAQSDPVVGRALRLIHSHTAHPWTVASLAAACGVSRAAFARRFSELVGEPPMAYLTRWRLTLAADLLREPDATVAAVARQVGYGTAFALSNAFKRERGISPRDHRLAAISSGNGNGS